MTEGASSTTAGCARQWGSKCEMGLVGSSCRALLVNRFRVKRASMIGVPKGKSAVLESKDS